MAAAEYDKTNAFRDATFTDADLSGLTVRSSDLRRTKIADSWLTDVRISGLVENLVVNDVDVTAYVRAELDRRHPERVLQRELASADDFRALWARLESLWADAVTRAEALPEEVRDERVDDEWSFVETLRHLVYVTDAWVGSTILDEVAPFHRIAITHTSYPADDAARLGMDPEAHPTFAEALVVRADRVTTVRDVLAELTDEALTRTCTRAPAPGYPDEPRTVDECLRVLMEEECEHYRYAVRDLAVLEAREAAARTTPS